MRSISLLVLLPLVACGGDDGPPVTLVDANVPQPDAPSATCYAQASYGSPTAEAEGALRFCATQTSFVRCPATATQGTTGTATDPLMIAYFARLNAANDFLNVELWKTDQNTPIGPGTADLATQNQYQTCALCVYINAQLNPQAGTDMGTYLATAGSASITTVTHNANEANTKIAGSLSNVMMQHVDIAQNGMSTPATDGCTTGVTSFSFDRAFADLQQQFTGKTLDQMYDYYLKRLNQRDAWRLR
jgi:hypothetical protein